MSTAQDKMLGYILNIASNETDLQKLAYGAKGIESLAGTMSLAGGEAYGLSWDESTDAYVRTGSDNYTAIQSKMRRCLLAPNGTVNAYLNPLNSNYTEDGLVANLMGGNGNVMVEIPKFYYKYNHIGTAHNWSISLTREDGYVVHPAFIKDGIEVDYRYIGAYEASTDGTKLKSVSGEYCDTNMTRATFRTRARAIGTGWGIQDWNLTVAVQLLMLIEYGTFRLQSVIGMGRTQLGGGDWVDGSCYAINGLSNAYGNQTKCVDYNGDGDDAGADYAFMSYRGIEHFWGNVWDFVDGINIKDHVPYISNAVSSFADDVFNGTYVSAGVTMGGGNGWQNTLCQSGLGFFPASVGASDTTKISDYYYQAAGDRVAFLGGEAANGSAAGAFCLGVHYASSGSYVSIGGRIAF